MNAIVQLLVKHGYSVLFASVFARQMCLPVPAVLFLIAAGALAGSGRLVLAVALSLSVIACLLADMVWYEAGRRWGDSILHFIYGLTQDPDAAARRSKKNFVPAWASDSHAGKVRRRTGRGNGSPGWALRHKPAPLHCP